MKHNDWTEQMRQRLGNARADVPDDMWAAIERKLDAQPAESPVSDAPRQRRVVAMRRWAVAASVAVVAGMGLWWQLRDSVAPADMPRAMGVVASDYGDKTAANNVADMAMQADGGAEALAARTHLANKKAATDAVAYALEAHMAASDAAEVASINSETGSIDDEATALSVDEAVSSPADNAVAAVAVTSDEPAARVGGNRKQTQQKTPTTTRRTTAMLRSERQSRAVKTSDGGSRWQVGMATGGSMYRYNASGGVMAVRQAADYMTAESNNNTLFWAEPMQRDLKESSHHSVPVSFGLTAAYRLTDRLSVTSGVVYTHASSTFEHGTPGSLSKDEQTLHYVGIPVSANFVVWGNRLLQTYVTAGAQADFNVAAKVTTGDHTADIDKDRAQFSVGGGVGVQLNIVKQLGVYVEPGVKYYFDNGSMVQNVFKDHPCNFSLQVGLRFNMK